MNRYYYYQVAKPEHRTWYKPIRDPVEEEALQREHAKVMEVSIEEEVATLIQRGATKELRELRGPMRDFRKPFQRLRAEKETNKQQVIEELLQEPRALGP